LHILIHTYIWVLINEYTAAVYNADLYLLSLESCYPFQQTLLKKTLISANSEQIYSEP